MEMTEAKRQPKEKLSAQKSIDREYILKWKNNKDNKKQTHWQIILT